MRNRHFAGASLIIVMFRAVSPKCSQRLVYQDGEGNLGLIAARHELTARKPAAR